MTDLPECLVVVQRRVDALNTAVKESERRLKDAQWELEDSTRRSQLRLKEQEQELRALEVAKQDMLQVCICM